MEIIGGLLVSLTISVLVQECVGSSIALYY